VGDMSPAFFSMDLKKIFSAYLLLILIISIFYFLNQRLVDFGFLIEKNRVLFNSFSLIGIVESFFVFGFIIPLLEELSFRAFLTKIHKFFYLGGSFFLVISFFKFLEIFYTLNLWIDIFLTFLLSIIIYYYIINKKIKLNYLNSNFIVSALLSSIIFAVFHIGINYVSESIIFLLISVLPFFFSGLIFCRVRIKLGFRYSLALHCLINFTGVLLNLL
jgi:hypothetical protein